MFGGVNMKIKGIVIDAKDIREIYNEFFVDMPEYISDDKFEEFVEFSQVDVYDWVQGNLRYFEPKSS